MLNNYLKESGLLQMKNKRSKERAKQTNLERYGVENVYQAKEIKDKIRSTMVERYGGATTMQSKTLKEKVINTNLKIYGSKNPMGSEIVKNKVKSTMVERYGGATTMQSKTLKEKVINTNLKIYGVKFASQLEKTKQKMKQTNIKRYGVDCTLKNENVRKILKERNLKKYGTEWHISSQQVKEKIVKTRRKRYGTKWNNIDKMKETNLKLYGVPYTCMSENCRKSQGNIISKINKIFSKFLTDNKIENELEFSISIKSFDIHILNTNILIEIDPSYTHNSTYKKWFHNYEAQPLSKEYHYNKTKTAVDNGYICIHKFDYNTNEEIIEKIKNINNYKITYTEPKLHWYNCSTKDHILDNHLNREEMISKGYIELYDDGSEWELIK